MQRMYWSEFRAAVDSKKTEWFEYRQNCWEKSPQGLEFRNKMSTEVADLVNRAKNITKRKGNEAGTEIEQAYEVMKLKELHKLEGNLYSSAFKDATVRDSIGLFYEKDFSKKLDAQPYLIGFANGVLNLRAERTNAAGNTEEYCEFREGKPEDFVSYQAGRWDPKQCRPINYEPFRADDPEQIEIDDFMTKVFPRADLRPICGASSPHVSRVPTENRSMIRGSASAATASPSWSTSCPWPSGTMQYPCSRRC